MRRECYSLARLLLRDCLFASIGQESFHCFAAACKILCGEVLYLLYDGFNRPDADLTVLDPDHSDAPIFQPYLPAKFRWQA